MWKNSKGDLTALLLQYKKTLWENTDSGRYKCSAGTLPLSKGVEGDWLGGEDVTSAINVFVITSSFLLTKLSTVSIAAYTVNYKR